VWFRRHGDGLHSDRGHQWNRILDLMTNKAQNEDADAKLGEDNGEPEECISIRKTESLRFPQDLVGGGTVWGQKSVVPGSLGKHGSEKGRPERA